MPKTECFFCKRKPSETGRQITIEYLGIKVKACKICRTIYKNGGNPDLLRLRKPKGKLYIKGKIFKVYQDLGHGKIILYEDGEDNFIAYFSRRLRYRHLYNKDNSYPVSVSVVRRLKELKIPVIIIKESSGKGFVTLYFFKTDDYANGMIIQHKNYDMQYSIPLEKAFKIKRL